MNMVYVVFQFDAEDFITPDAVWKWNLIERVRSRWKWIILPRDFNSQKIENLTMWQSWTIRRAVFSRKDRKC